MPNRHLLVRIAAVLRTLVLALAAAAALAAPAGAQAPIDLGPGRGPSLVVDAAGTAHIAYRSLDVRNATAHSVTYCRLPRGAAACDVRVVLPLPRHPGSVKIEQRADGALIILAADSEALWVAASADGGATFAGPRVLATGQDGAAPAGLSPDGQGAITLGLTREGTRLWRSPFAGADPRVLALNSASADLAPSYDLAVFGGGRMLTVAESGRGTEWSVFTGGDPLDPNAWPRRGTLRGHDNPVLAAGPRGVFLLEDRTNTEEILDRKAPFAIRSFDTRRLRWRAPRTLGADALGQSGAAFHWWPTADLAQDARGRLHLATAARDHRGGECIQYARTGPRSKQWFGRTTTLYRTRNKALQPEAPKVAAAPDGRGVIAWHTRTGTLAAEGNVYVMRTRQAKGRYRAIRDASDRPACGRRR